MDISYHIAQNGLNAGTIRQSVIANNLSNLTTDGFRSQLVESSTVRGPGTQILGIRDSQELGALRQTSRATDFFLDGEGFFKIQTQDGTAYTRHGQFGVDGEGNLVTSSGYLVDPQITLPEDTISVRTTRDGNIFTIDAEGLETNVGQLEVTRFINPSGLLAIGDSLYVQGPNSGDPLDGVPGDPGFATVVEGALESSTVDPSREVTNQIVNQRYYQMNLRSFQTADALVSRTLDIFS